MRIQLVAASLLALSLPAAAAAAEGPAERRAQDAVERALPPQAEIEAMGEALARVTDALMDVDIAPVVDAIDPAARRERRRDKETLGDIASRDDPHARERVRDSVSTATVGMGALMREMAVLTPVLARSLDDVARRMEEAMRESRDRVERNRDDRRRESDRRR